jgi:hypothetical protein
VILYQNVVAPTNQIAPSSVSRLQRALSYERGPPAEAEVIFPTDLVYFALLRNLGFETRRVSIRNRFTGRASVAILGTFGVDSLVLSPKKSG